MTDKRFSELSASRQSFVRLCQKIGFGKIEALEVRDAEPLFGPQTRAFVDLRLDSDDSPRPERILNDFVVSAEVRRLFSELDAIRDGTVERIEIRAGVARRMIFKASDPK